MFYLAIIKNKEKMKLQLDKITMTKTGRFLKPCLRKYGVEFSSKLSKIFKLAYGIGDMLIKKSYEKHIFILCDISKCTDFFKDFLEYFRRQDYYETDYAADHILYGKYHMLVIKIPKEWLDKLPLFQEGKYSKMYSKEEIKELHEQDRLVVIKDKNYRFEFVKKVNEQFGTKLKEEELDKDAELEIPPNIDELEYFQEID